MLCIKIDFNTVCRARKMKFPPRMVLLTSCTLNCRRPASRVQCPTQRLLWNDAGNRNWRENCNSSAAKMAVLTQVRDWVHVGACLSPAYPASISPNLGECSAGIFGEKRFHKAWHSPHLVLTGQWFAISNFGILTISRELVNSFRIVHLHINFDFGHLKLSSSVRDIC